MRPAWFNLPNFLTLVRLALVPVVIRAILDGRGVAAGVWFGIAAVTDILDGAAARRFGDTTQAGAYLDPIADKCLLSGVFLALGAAGTVPWWFVGLVLGRDLYILLGVAAFMLFTDIRKFPPSVWGKVSTFVQIVTVVFFLSREVLEIPLLTSPSPAILWLCVVSTSWSGIHYTWTGVRLARTH